MTPLSSFLPEIMLAAPGLADVVAESYVRNAAITFCNLTKCITETLDAETVAAGDYEYDVVPGGSEELVEVLNVYVDGRPIDPISEQELRRGYGAWRDKSGHPSHYKADTEVLRLFPIPTTAVSVEAEIVKRPTTTTTHLADALYKEWREAIAAGAMSKILMIPGQTFTNPQMAAVYGVMFSDWQVTAQAKTMKRTAYAPLRVEPA